MHVLIVLDPQRLSRWHIAVNEAVRARASSSIQLLEASTRQPRARSLDLLLSIDRILHGGATSGADPISPTDLRAPAHNTPGTKPDLILNLTGRDAQNSDTRALTPLYDGDFHDDALWSALLDGRAPTLALADTSTSHPILIGQPALETPHRLRASAASVYARVAEGLVRALRELSEGRTVHHGAPPSQAKPIGSTSAARFAANTIAAKASRRLQHMLSTAPQWAVAWRAAPNGRELPTHPVDPRLWSLVPDDRQRYFADPFVIAHNGQRHMFVEELPYATGRGIISHLIIDAQGRAAPPRPVLEAPWHLSYPQVFEHGGAIYMLPEASASGALDLYRADPFPDRWVPVARLLNERVHDATLIEHGGKFWMFAATDTGESSSWDALSLSSANTLFGPWTPHPSNPVLLDAGSARPGGSIFRIGIDLWRPAQDCRDGYGAALSLARVTQLDDTGYAQDSPQPWRCTYASKLLGPHTWNVGAGLEVIDVFGPKHLLSSRPH